MTRLDEMRYNEDMRRAEHTDELLAEVSGNDGADRADMGVLSVRSKNTDISTTTAPVNFDHINAYLERCWAEREKRRDEFWEEYLEMCRKRSEKFPDYEPNWFGVPIYKEDTR